MYELVEFELHQRANAKLSISALLSYCGQYKAVRRVCDFRASLEIRGCSSYRHKSTHMGAQVTRGKENVIMFFMNLHD